MMIMNNQVLFDKKLSCYDKMVWMVLANHEDLKNASQLMINIAEESKMSVETVRRCIRHLIDRGYVNRRRRRTSSRFGYIYSIPDKYKVKTLK